MSLIVYSQLNQKCRICLEIRTDLTSFVAPMYLKDEDNTDTDTDDCQWYSLAEILQSITTVEVIFSLS